MERFKRYRRKYPYGDRNYLLEDLLALLAAVTVVFVLLMLASCERRELYVFGDEFRSVDLNVDWRRYADRDPDGMTAWFYPLNTEGTVLSVLKPYRTTTAEVRRHELYLPGGRYQGVVIDYSPEEYSRQQFLDIDSLPAARVEATPSAYQPDSLTVAGEGVPAGLSDEVNWQLFGEPAWTDLQYPRPPVREESGLYTVASQPEQMALDTLDDKTVDRGLYGDYIPWKERDTYQSSITIKHLYSEPQSIVWQLRIRVWIRNGFNYLWQTPASISGLADGHFLPRDVITDQPCLLSIDGWELERTGDNEGYISATLTTFALRPETLQPDRELRSGNDVSERIFSYSRVGETEPDYGDPARWEHYVRNCLPRDIRLNLSFVLRDHATVLNYHFNVGHYVVSWDNQLVLRIDLGPEFFDPDNPHGAGGEGGDPDNPGDGSGIDLPYVDAYNGTGFGADVTPWEDMPPIDVSF